VGRRKIFLVTSAIVLRDADNRILLQHRTDFDVWGLPGGALEIDEDIQACAHRELFEETGLEAGEFDLVGVYTHPQYDVTYPNGDETQQYTICLTSYLSGGTMRPDGVETSGQAFFTPAEMADLTIPHWYQAMIRDALRGGPPAFIQPYVAERPYDQIQLMRQFVGQERIIAVGAMTAVQRDDGRFLVVRRADNGEWTFPAGYSDLGENVAHTAVRETLEETGCHVRLGELTSINSYTDEPNITFTFTAEIVGGQLTTGPETAAFAWCQPGEEPTNTPPQHRERVAHACKPSGNVMFRKQSSRIDQ